VSGPIGYDDLRADTVRQVAKLMAAAAITAPKSGGQLFLAGKHLFIETVIIDDTDTLRSLAGWWRARGKERPAGAGPAGLGALDVEADDRRLLERASFVYDALYAWCARQVGEAA
jgi:hypothetical protein